MQEVKTRVGNKVSASVQLGSETKWVSLSPCLVEESLCLYPTANQHIRQLAYYCGMLRGNIEPHQIDYSTITVPYYTAQQIVEITSQAAYLLAAATMTHGDVPELPDTLYQMFMKRMREGSVYYTGISLCFRRKVSNTVHQPMVISLKRACCHARMQIILAHMNFGEGSVHVDTQLVMPLESN